jgi:hypothetical protein
MSMWFPRLNWKDCKLRSYGGFVPGVKIGRWVAAVTLAGMLAGPAASASDRALRIVALGDSLTAGYGLAADEAFPVKLQRALAAKGIAAEIANAGVSGDTASGGLARLDWSVPDGTDAVILELGANDALRGVDPKVTRGALEALLRRLGERIFACCCAACWRPATWAPTTAPRSMPSTPISPGNTAPSSISSSSTGWRPTRSSTSAMDCTRPPPASM